MTTATVNDMVIATIVGTNQGPGAEHAQILGTEGAKKVALIAAIKAVLNPGGPTLTLLVEIQGSTDLANWHPLSGASLSFALAGSYNSSDKIDGISVDGWPWVRVRYYLTSTDYTVIRSVLLSATLSAAG